MKIRNPFVIIIWSFGLFILMNTWQYLGALITSMTSNIPFESIISGSFKNEKVIIMMGLVASIVGIPLIFVITKYLWKRDFTWMRLHFNLTYFIKGVLGGIILPVVIIIALIIYGNASIVELPNRFTAINLTAVLIGYLGLSMFTAISEEIVFRAIVTREIATKWNWVIATLIGGIYFGLIHVISVINVVVIMDILWIIISSMIVSFLFVAMYIRSKSLWLPIGFHAGWNYSLTAIIGTKMSGKESLFGMFNLELSGNQIITGGQFGIETSVVSLIAYILIAILLIKYSINGKVDLLSNTANNAEISSRTQADSNGVAMNTTIKKISDTYSCN